MRVRRVTLSLLLLATVATCQDDDETCERPVMRCAFNPATQAFDRDCVSAVVKLPCDQAAAADSCGRVSRRCLWDEATQSYTRDCVDVLPAIETNDCDAGAPRDAPTQ